MEIGADWTEYNSNLIELNINMIHTIKYKITTLILNK